MLNFNLAGGDSKALELRYVTAQYILTEDWNVEIVFLKPSLKNKAPFLARENWVIFHVYTLFVMMKRSSSADNLSLIH